MRHDYDSLICFQEPGAPCFSIHLDYHAALVYEMIGIMRRVDIIRFDTRSKVNCLQELLLLYADNYMITIENAKKERISFIDFILPFFYCI